MNDKEREKKQVEVAEVEPVAVEINSKFGTDYVAKPGDNEPADVMLLSASGAHPARPVQVVSIPRDYEIRADNKNIERLKSTLAEALRERGVSRCSVGVTVLANASKRGMPQEQIEHLADEIAKTAASIEPGGICEFDHMCFLGIDPELTAYIGNAVVFRDNSHDGVTVDTPGVAAQLPDDGKWIEEGIQLKLRKYGGADAVRDLMLVMAVEALVDRQQVDAFIAANPPDKLPFAEIWINSIEGVICLKSRT